MHVLTGKRIEPPVLPRRLPYGREGQPGYEQSANLKVYQKAKDLLQEKGNGRVKLIEEHEVESLISEIKPLLRGPFTTTSMD